MELGTNVSEKSLIYPNDRLGFIRMNKECLGLENGELTVTHTLVEASTTSLQKSDKQALCLFR